MSFFRTVKFGAGPSGSKRVAEEEIIDVPSTSDEPETKKLKEEILGGMGPSKTLPKKKLSIGVVTKKASLQGLVKKKEPVASAKPEKVDEKPSGLSLLGAYSDSDSNESS